MARVAGVIVVGMLTAVTSSAAAPVPDVSRAAPIVLPAAPAIAAAPAPEPGPAAPAPPAIAAAPAPGPAPAAPAPAPRPAVVPGTPCSPAARACADLSTNQAWLIRDGRIEYGPTRIVHGRPGYRTRPGTFRVTYKSRNHVSSIYDVAMPNAVFFNGNIAFHQGVLRGGSHGCVRLSKAASRVFFGALQRGDVVQVVR